MKHSSFWIGAIVAWTVFLLASALGAAGPSDKGIQINYGAAPLASPYNGQPAHAVLAANYSPSTVTGNDFASPLRLQTYWQQGGQYNGSAQTAYPVSNANTTMRGQGQGVGYWHSIGGYGKGNAGFGNGVATCYGGGETALPSSTPYCGALGEFDAVQAPLVWKATLTTPISSGVTTLHYTSPVNNSSAGARFVLNKNHVVESGTITAYATCTDSVAGACSVTSGTCPLGAGSTCTVITLSGATLPTGSPTAWYYKSKGVDDYYDPACTNDDVNIGGKCVGHWYAVGDVPDNSHLVLKGVFDSINLNANIGGTDYLMLNGIEATAVDPTAQTLTIPSNSLNWANAELVYSPPSHVIGLIGTLVVLTKEYKTGFETATSYGYGVNSNGTQPIENGVWITGTGGFRRGVKIENGNATANDSHGVDVDATYNSGLLYTGNNDATHYAVRSGTSGQCVYGCGISGTANTLDGEMVSVGVGIDTDGGGKKIGFVTDSSSLGTLARIDETITWTTAFRGTTYSPICTVEESTGHVTAVGVKTINAGSLVVTVQNTDAVSAHSPFTVHCLAEWRGN